MIHDFLSFYIVARKCDEWKEEAFLWSAPGDFYISDWLLTDFAPGDTLVTFTLRHIYCSDRPKYFFLRQQKYHEQHFSNLFSTEWASLDGWKISYNFEFWNSI